MDKNKLRNTITPAKFREMMEPSLNEASPHQSFDMKNVERLYKENDRWLQKNGLAWIRNNPHMANNLYATANWFDKISKMMLKHYAQINKEISKELGPR